MVRPSTSRRQAPVADRVHCTQWRPWSPRAARGPSQSNASPGVRTTRQARSRWEEEFEERLDPTQRPYYWLGGRFIDLDEGDDTDLAAIRDGYVSVTPLQLDLTAHDHLAAIRSLTDSISTVHG